MFSSLLQRYRSDISKATARLLTQVNDAHLPDTLELLPHNELVAFFNDCHRLSKDETLRKVINALTKEQSQHILLNIENDIDLLCTRSSILGVNAVMQRLNAYAQRAERTPEEFDKFAVL